MWDVWPLIGRKKITKHFIQEKIATKRKDTKRLKDTKEETDPQHEENKKISEVSKVLKRKGKLKKPNEEEELKTQINPMHLLEALRLVVARASLYYTKICKI